MIRTSTLSCGVRVVSEAMPHMQSASLGLWVNVGSSAEPASKRGMSHLLEHMLFKGTATRSASDVGRAINDVGGTVNGFTTRESTCFHTRTAGRDVPVAVDLLSDMIRNATIDEAALVKEQKVVLREIHLRDDSNERMLHTLYTRGMFGESPLGEPVIGTARTVASITRDDLVDHLRTFYRSDGLVIAAAGNVDHDELTELFEPAFADFSGGAPLREPACPTVRPVSRVAFRECDQASVAIVAEGLPEADPQRSVMRVLVTLLGVGRSSRLWNEVRERHALAYRVGAFQSKYRRAGLCGVLVGTSPGTVGECVDVISEQLARLRETKADESELRLVKNQIKGRRALARENTSARMRALGSLTLAGRKAVSDEVYEARIDAVTAAEVRLLAARIFAPERLGFFALGPIDEDAVFRGAAPCAS